mmetsp:Transcript_54592/g.75663  ORF Transcript_54592/g.75663 Transcript_54592/m.75663 type:complete len:204 (+) Transcript_54592:402-1013(+)
MSQRRSHILHRSRCRHWREGWPADPGQHVPVRSLHGRCRLLRMSGGVPLWGLECARGACGWHTGDRPDEAEVLRAGGAGLFRPLQKGGEISHLPAVAQRAGHAPGAGCLPGELALRSSTGRDAFADCAGDRSAQRCVAAADVVSAGGTPSATNCRKCSGGSPWSETPPHHVQLPVRRADGRRQRSAFLRSVLSRPRRQAWLGT